MLALRMQATTGNQSKQQQQQQQQQQEETSLYSSSSDASECGSDGDESLDDSDPDGMDTPLYSLLVKPFLLLYKYINTESFDVERNTQ